MSDWLQLAIILAIGLPTGVALRFYARRRHQAFLTRLERTGRSISWPYYVAGAIFLSALAVACHERVLFAILFSISAAGQCYLAVRVVIRERTQYGLRHLLMVTALAAVVATFCRWLGMAMVPILAWTANSAMLLLFVLEWRKHKSTEEDPAGDE